MVLVTRHGRVTKVTKKVEGMAVGYSPSNWKLGKEPWKVGGDRLTVDSWYM